MDRLDPLNSSSSQETAFESVSVVTSGSVLKCYSHFFSHLIGAAFTQINRVEVVVIGEKSETDLKVH